MRKNLKMYSKPGRAAYRLRRFFVRRNYKDRLFVALFHSKKELLQLYNGLNGTNYTNPDDLEITTMDDVVYLGMKNDCSFMIGSYLNLYEQQSTFCPNMPIRGLIYLIDIYQSYIAKHQFNLYGRKRIMLPTPKYIVFYNGTEERPDREECRLSESFKESDGCLEFVATVYNINKGHNQELMKQCSTLAGYSTLIDMVRNYQKAGMGLAEAVDAACVYCIENDILREYLEKNRSEVMRVLLTEYDAKKQRKMDMRDAREEGKAEGRAEGEAEERTKFLRLIDAMAADGKTAEIPRLSREPGFLREMENEYHIR
ncbi:MAG: hypothetical protein Q4F28_01135 [Eubacteriales bacterium]|nr:hypothetical protein [Eubacteriales bacterium]